MWNTVVKSVLLEAFFFNLHWTFFEIFSMKYQQVFKIKYC